VSLALLVISLFVFGDGLRHNVLAVVALRGWLQADAAWLLRAEELATRRPSWLGSSRADNRLKAIASIALGRPERAVETLRQFEGPGIVGALECYWLGVAYDTAGDRESALRVWLAIGATPTAVERARLRARSGDLQGAIDEYDMILAIAPRLPEASSGKLEVALLKADWSAVAASSRELQVERPTDPQALVGLGLALWHLEGDADGSTTLMRRAIAHHPDCVWCFLNLEEVARDAGRLDEARAACLAAERLRHGNARRCE
jgi:tetratricopeptide (TPR) repeat protein